LPPGFTKIFLIFENKNYFLFLVRNNLSKTTKGSEKIIIQISAAIFKEFQDFFN